MNFSKRIHYLLAASLIACLVTFPQPVQATTAPPRSNSIYGMDILGASWQWVFPREEAWPRMSGSIRLDLLDSAFRQAAEAGVRWNRLAVWWCMVEPERGQYFWDDVDAAIQIGRNYGIETVPELFFTPYWAVAGAPRTPECISNSMRNYPPSDMTDWENYVRAIVRRYGAPGQGAVRYWEIWNEPDLYEFLAPNPPGSDTKAIYAELLIRAARVIRAESPGASVLFGGLSDINSVPYLSGILALRGALDVRQSFDILSLHAYSQHVLRINALHDVLEANGLGQRPMWDTELNNFGWDYDAARVGLPGLFRSLAGAGVTRTFWYIATTSNWGPGIFEPREPTWDPLPFTPSPFYAIFRAQAAPFRLPGQPTPQAPAAVVRKTQPVFLWETQPAGDYPIAGYKLQLDRTLFRGAALFARPEVDAWVSTGDRASYLPLIVAGGGSTAFTAARTPTRTQPRELVSYFLPTPLDWGTHYWRVAAVDSQGNVGPYSAPRVVTVRMPFSAYLPLLTP